MHPSENAVGLGILAGSFLPSFNDACVVAIVFKAVVRVIEGDKRPGENLKGDGIGPADVTTLRVPVPVSNEDPCTPIFSHNNAAKACS